YNGDNYTEEWHNDAAKRGLPNFKSTTDCLPVFKKKEVIDLLTKYKVYSAKELESRYNILSEKYVKEIVIEANTMINLAKTLILPAALRYQKEVGDSISSAKAAGANTPAGIEILSAVVTAISDFQRGIDKLDKAVNHHADGDAFAHAKYTRENIVPA